MASVTQKYDSIQYDGTNGTFICEGFLDGSAYALVNDTGTLLTFTDSENSLKAVPLDGWVVRSTNHELVWRGSNASYAAQWTEIT